MSIESKQKIRAAAKSAVLALSITQKASSSEAIFRCVASLDKVRLATTVALFSSLPDEPQTEKIITHLAAERRVVLPRVDGEDMDFFHSLFFPLFKSALTGGFVEQNSRGTGDIEGIDFAQHRDIHFQVSLFHPEVGQAGLFRSDYHCYRLGEVDIGVFEVSMRSCSKYLYSAFAQIIHC